MSVFMTGKKQKSILGKVLNFLNRVVRVIIKEISDIYTIIKIKLYITLAFTALIVILFVILIIIQLFQVHT